MPAETAEMVAAQAEPDVAARCTGVTKIYWTPTGEVHAVQSIDAVFPAAEVTAVVGPSGSGKSSLLRMLAAVDRPTAGQVRIADHEIGGMRPTQLRRLRRKQIGYVFQRPADNLISYLTVADHMRLAGRLRRMGRKRTESDAGDLLEALGLTERRNHLPHQLSGGEQQRLAFAQVVVGRPAMVVADEPTAELDSASGQALLDSIIELARLGTAFVVSTHDPAAVRAADRTLYLRHGALQAESTKGQQHMDLHDIQPLAVIDQSGRIQLPPEALKLFPARRAVLRWDDDEVRITPP